MVFPIFVQEDMGFKHSIPLRNGTYAEFVGFKDKKAYYEIPCPCCGTPTRGWVLMSEVMSSPEEVHPASVRDYESGGRPFRTLMCPCCGVNFDPVLK